MRTIFLKIKILLLMVVLLTSPAVAAKLEIVTGSDSVIQGEQILVTVMRNGMPVENVFLQFSIDGGTPIYAKTNATGRAVFKPDITGTLKIVAMKDDEMSASKYITVTQSSDGDGGDGGGGDGNGGISYWWSGGVALPSGTFTKTAFNTNKTYTINWWTALGALEAASRKGGFDYKIEETSWGPFVYSIGDKKKYDEGETSGWMYQVNGESPMVGAHEYLVNIGDEIIWYFSKSMDTTPLTSSRVLKIKIVSSGGGPSGGGGISSTPTPAPTQVVEVVKEIEPIEAGANASVTFDTLNVTRIRINANNTIRNASIVIQPIENPVNITNVSGIPYCYFDVTTINLTDTDITSATIEFKVNKTWINERNIDEATITLNKYSDINNNWSVLPTLKIEEDNTSFYFESETQSFSLFAISGEEKTVHLATEAGAETETPMPEAIAGPSPTPIPIPIHAPTPVTIIPMFLILIVIPVIVIAGMIIVVLRRK